MKVFRICYGATLLLGLVLLTACNPAHRELRLRASELCRYTPNPDCLERSKDYLTEDYYNTLEQMMAQPDSTPVLHEWEFWFVAADGSPIASCSCKVLKVACIDENNAEAQLLVRPADRDYPAENHTLSLHRIDGVWLLSDFDDTHAAALRRLNILQ